MAETHAARKPTLVLSSPAELAIELTPSHHAQVTMEELWEVGHPEIRPQHTAMHEKLAAVFTYISAGTSCSPLTQLKMLMRI